MQNKKHEEQLPAGADFLGGIGLMSVSYTALYDSQQKLQEKIARKQETEIDEEKETHRDLAIQHSMTMRYYPKQEPSISLYTPTNIFVPKGLAKGLVIDYTQNNQTFEAWLLLHFGPYNKQIVNKEEYYKELDKALGKKYDKTDKDLFEYLKDKIEMAITNAKKLSPNPAFDITCEPSTNVHELVAWVREMVR